MDANMVNYYRWVIPNNILTPYSFIVNMELMPSNGICQIMIEDEHEWKGCELSELLGSVEVVQKL